MKDRVYGADEWHKSYRGLYVCDRWRDSFENFLADMGPRPLGTTLDRKDGTRGYEPGNCRWATHEEQQRNLKSNVIPGTSLEEEATRVGIPVNTMRSRRRRGLDMYAPAKMGAKNPRRGASNPRSKLDEEKVRAILASTATERELAAQYGVTHENIHFIKTRQTWRHVIV